MRVSRRPGAVVLCLCGVRVAIESGDRPLLSRLVARVPSGWKPSRGAGVERLYSVRRTGRCSTELWVNGERLARLRSARHLLRLFESDLQRYVSEWSRGRLFVHAGAVGWGGRAVLVPGGSMSGKSRLVQALVAAGGRYYSDEYAVLDGRGRVHPWPVPLSLRGTKGGPTTKIPAETLGAAGGPPLAVSWVIAATYRRGGCWRPRALSAGRAALALLAHTVPARRAPETALDVLARAVASSRALRGVRGEARDVVDWLQRVGGICPHDDHGTSS